MFHYPFLSLLYATVGHIFPYIIYDLIRDNAPKMQILIFEFIFLEITISSWEWKIFLNTVFHYDPVILDQVKALPV